MKYVQIHLQSQDSIQMHTLPHNPAGYTQTSSDLAYKEPSKWMVRPETPGRMIWDIIGIAVLLLELIWIPMQVYDITVTLGIALLQWVD